MMSARKVFSSDLVSIDLVTLTHTMIIPHVYHGNLRVGHSKQALREPHGIPVEIKAFQLLLHFDGELDFVLVMWIFYLKPFLEQFGLTHDCIIIYLVSTPNHDMKRSRLVAIENIAP